MNKYASIRATNASAAQTNPAPVDVLAVMDEARALAIDERNMHDDNNNKPMADNWESFRADVVQARAAVAELIDAAKRVASYSDDSYGPELGIAELIQAIDRCGGTT